MKYELGFLRVILYMQVITVPLRVLNRLVVLYVGYREYKYALLLYRHFSSCGGRSGLRVRIRYCFLKGSEVYLTVEDEQIGR